MFKDLTWVQGGDFRSWWFEDKNEKRVGPKVKERSLYYIVGVNGEELEFSSIEDAAQFIEESLRESMRP